MSDSSPSSLYKQCLYVVAVLCLCSTAECYHPTSMAVSVAHCRSCVRFFPFTLLVIILCISNVVVVFCICSTAGGMYLYIIVLVFSYNLSVCSLLARVLFIFIFILFGKDHHSHFFACIQEAKKFLRKTKRI